MDQSLQRKIDSHLRKPDPLFDYTHKLIITYGVAAALEHLHGKNHVHRDIKPENILLDKSLYPFLADFGTSKDVDESLNANVTIDGTSPYTQAPEFFETGDKLAQARKDPKADVYSFGISLYYLWSGQNPKHQYESDIFVYINAIKKGERPSFEKCLQTVPEPIKRLIEQCWVHVPKDRLTFTEIVNKLESPEFQLSSQNFDKNLFAKYVSRLKSHRHAVESQQINDPSMLYYFSQKKERGLDMVKDVVEAMNLLQRSADLGYVDSQLSYGLHLYKGYNIAKNESLAIHYFELAASLKNATAQFYMALINLQRGQDYTSYFTASVNQNQPDAYAFNGKLHLDGGNLDYALQFINPSLSGGSLLGFLTMGNLCEQYPDYGDSSFFYQIASQHCHCLDTHGFMTPIPYKKYHCDQCNQDMCEGCAKYCHQGHSIRLLCEESCFTCDCGSHGFNSPKPHCNAEYLGEQRCHQHLYQCLTCSLGSRNEYICKGCIEHCHQGHTVVDCGVIQNEHSYCHCGMQKLLIRQANGKQAPFQCSLLKYGHYSECTGFEYGSTFPVTQRAFQCITDGIYSRHQHALCEVCANECRSGNHFLIDRGVQPCICYHAYQK